MPSAPDSNSKFQRLLQSLTRALTATGRSPIQPLVFTTLGLLLGLCLRSGGWLAVLFGTLAAALAITIVIFARRDLKKTEAAPRQITAENPAAQNLPARPTAPTTKLPNHSNKRNRLRWRSRWRAQSKK